MNANGSWSGNPVSTNAGVFAVAGTGTNPTLTNNLTLQSLTFAGAGVSGWTVSGPYTLTLNVAAAISGSNTSDTNTISSNIAFTNAAPVIVQATGGALVLSGNLTGTNVSFGGITNGTNAVIALTGSNSFQTFKFGNNTAGNGATYQFGSNYAIVGSGSWTESNSQTFQAIDRDVNLSGLTNTFFRASTTFGGTQSLTIGGTIGSTVTAATAVIFTNNLISSKTLSFTAVDLAVTGSAQAKNNFTVAGSGNTSFLGSIFQTSTSAQGITISSTGLTTFSGSNSYAGTTTINSGATLKLDNANALPSSGALTLAGGVLGLGSAGNSSFTRAAGSGAGQVSWNSGGFAAYGSDATVNIGGAAALLNAATTTVWSATTADRTVELVNPYNLGSTVKSVTVNNGSADVDARFSGVVQGFTGPYTKNGAGTLEWTAANTYSGTVAITAGQLRFSGTGSLTGTTGPVVVNGSGAELKWNSSVALTRPLTVTQGTISGTGRISATGGVSIGTNAVLSPGNSPGTQAFTTGLTLAPGGTYVWEVNSGAGTTGTNWDLINVTSGGLNLASLSNAAKFNLDLTTLTASGSSGSMDNYTPGGSYTWRIFDANALTLPGSFSAPYAGTDITSLFNVLTTNWQGTAPASNDISVKVAADGTGIDLVVVPEPGTIALGVIGIGLAGLATWRRRRR
jgi:autotransporter-associated beta strand protein